MRGSLLTCQSTANASDYTYVVTSDATQNVYITFDSDNII
jgi:hypothetical protein